MIEFDPFRYDAESRLLYRGDDEIMLPPRVLAVLESLLKRPGKVVAKEDVLASAWEGAFVGEDSLTQAISQLRQALGDDPQRPTYIQTIPRRGYRFIAAVSEPLVDEKEKTERRGGAATRLEGAPAGPSSRPGPGLAASATDRPATRVRVNRLLPWAIALVAGVTAVLAVSLPRGSPTAPHSGWHLFVPLEEGLRLTGGRIAEEGLGLQRPLRTALAWSRDGNELIYAATDGTLSRLYRRRMDQGRAIPIAGTEGGSFPFVSPDGREIGFYANGALKSVAREGGEVRTLVADAGTLFGATWGDDGTIAYSTDSNEALMRVSAAGGEPTPLTEVDWDGGETSHRSPHFLAGGDAFLYTVMHGNWLWGLADVVVQSIDGSRREVLIEGGTDARYVATGHLLFVRDGTLMAIRFDPTTLATSGEPIPVLEDVMQAAYANSSVYDSGEGQFSVSSTGNLAFVTGGVFPEYEKRFVLVDREGNEEIVPLDPGDFAYPQLSPDGRYLAYEQGPPGHVRVWIYDWSSGFSQLLLADGSSAGAPVWGPKGDRIAFAKRSESHNVDVYLVDVDADVAAEPRQLWHSVGSSLPASWSVRGALAFVDYVEDHDIWVLPGVDGGAEAEPFAVTPGVEESHPAFSPDGDWIAYASSHEDGVNVYVRRYPGSGRPIRASPNGGTRPAWSPGGGELFYELGDRRFAVSVSWGDPPSFGPPELLFDKEFYRTHPLDSYEVTADGRFLMILDPQNPPQPVSEIRVILGWLEAMGRRPSADG